jgi:hypothetical protein
MNKTQLAAVTNQVRKRMRKTPKVSGMLIPY